MLHCAELKYLGNITHSAGIVTQTHRQTHTDRRTEMRNYNDMYMWITTHWSKYSPRLKLKQATDFPQEAAHRVVCSVITSNILWAHSLYMTVC